jgi:hypothetical protein
MQKSATINTTLMTSKRNASARFVEHSLKDLPVLFRRLDQPDTRLVDPALHAVHGLDQGQWPLMQAEIRGDANEGRKDGPTQAYRRGSAQLRVPSCAGQLVVSRKAVFRVEQDVWVHEDHG